MKLKDYLIILLFFITDLISKLLVTNYINYHENIEIIKNFFYLTYVKNDGASFSILSGMQILLIIISIIFLVFVFRYLYKNKLNKGEKFLILMITGGVIGNLIDRIRLNYVIDFLEFHFGNYIFPIFNLADCFIVVGTITLIIIYIRRGIYERNHR